MANYYTEASSERIVPCTHDQYQRLSEILQDSANQSEDPHDFMVEWIEAHNDDPAGLYLRSVGAGFAEPYHLPLCFRVELGKLLTEANLPYLTIGLAFMCEKNRLNSHGGETVRLYPNGTVVSPSLVWPIQVPDP